MLQEVLGIRKYMSTEFFYLIFFFKYFFRAHNKSIYSEEDVRQLYVLVELIRAIRIYIYTQLKVLFWVEKWWTSKIFLFCMLNISRYLER
jgi:hypothetical protein